MGNYKVTFKKSVEKDLKPIPKSDVIKIISKIDTLAQDPRRVGAIKLSDNELYRIRQGLYRIVYEIKEATDLMFINVHKRVAGGV